MTKRKLINILCIVAEYIANENLHLTKEQIYRDLRGCLLLFSQTNDAYILMKEYQEFTNLNVYSFCYQNVELLNKILYENI